jgi:hypothetical protein
MTELTRPAKLEKQAEEIEQKETNDFNDTKHCIININGLQASNIYTSEYTMLRYSSMQSFSRNEKKKILNNYEVNNDFITYYINPSTMSYNNIENILDIDIDTNCKLSNFSNICENKVFHCTISNISELLKLHELDLYALPLNSNSRGGKRMIFSSKKLSNKLTSCFHDHIKNDTEINEDKQTNNKIDDNKINEDKQTNNKIDEDKQTNNKIDDNKIDDNKIDDNNIWNKKKIKQLRNIEKPFLQLLKKEEKNVEGTDKNKPIRQKKDNDSIDSIDVFLNNMENNEEVEEDNEDMSDSDDYSEEDDEGRVFVNGDEEDEAIYEEIDVDEYCDFNKIKIDYNGFQSNHFNISKEQTQLNDIHPNLLTNFNSINNVFRLNCFDNNDNDFKLHYDTPFVNEGENIYSKYTILIYLTDCYNKNGSLSFPEINFNITRINAGDVFLFEQTLEHIGRSSDKYEGDIEYKEKIFIRSELLYTGIDELQHSDEVAKTFNKACYFSKEAGIIINKDSEQSEQMQEYSSLLFNNTMKLRNKLEQIDINNLFVKKDMKIDNNTIDFITNGDDYYFKDIDMNKDNDDNDGDEDLETVSNNIRNLSDNIKFMAMVVMIDYFNGNIGLDTTIKKTTHTTIIENKTINDENKNEKVIMSMLKGWSFKHSLKKINKKPCEYLLKDYSGEEEIDIVQDYCGMFRGKECNNPSSIDEHEDEYNSKLAVLERNIEEFNIVLFNDEIYASPSTLTVTKNKIKCHQSKMNTINFASCQCGRTLEPYEFLEQHVKYVSGFTFPDIHYKKIEDGYKLSIDMFKNGFVYSKKNIMFEEPHVFHEGF